MNGALRYPWPGTAGRSVRNFIMPNGRRCYAERGEQPDGQLRRSAHAEPMNGNAIPMMRTSGITMGVTMKTSSGPSMVRTSYLRWDGPTFHPAVTDARRPAPSSSGLA